MYKKRSNFVRGLRKGTYTDVSIIANHPLIETKGYPNKKTKKIHPNQIKLKELRDYSSSVVFKCSLCEHSNELPIDDLIKNFGGSNTFENLKNKFVCRACNSKQFNFKFIK
jgi:hypothetical protein